MQNEKSKSFSLNYLIADSFLVFAARESRLLAILTEKWGIDLDISSASIKA